MKDCSVVLNSMAGVAGEVLDRNRTHIIKKDASGKIDAIFDNPGQEDNVVKLTLTALAPNAQFEVTVSGKPEGKKKANIAGVLESRFVLQARQRLRIREL